MKNWKGWAAQAKFSFQNLTHDSYAYAIAGVNKFKSA